MYYGFMNLKKKKKNFRMGTLYF